MHKRIRRVISRTLALAPSLLLASVWWLLWLLWPSGLATARGQRLPAPRATYVKLAPNAESPLLMPDLFGRRTPLGFAVEDRARAEALVGLPERDATLPRYLDWQEADRPARLAVQGVPATDRAAVAAGAADLLPTAPAFKLPPRRPRELAVVPDHRLRTVGFHVPAAALTNAPRMEQSWMAVVRVLTDDAGYVSHALIEQGTADGQFDQQALRLARLGRVAPAHGGSEGNVVVNYGTP